MAKWEPAREAEQRLAREREADSLQRGREADRLARKRVARESRGLGVGQCIVTALVSTVCHALLVWNSGPMLSASGVAKQEPAREAEQRLVRDREADSLQRGREADRLARKRVAKECRGLGVGQCIVTARVSTVCHALLVWNSGPIPTFTPPTMVHYAQASLVFSLQ